MNPIVAVDFDNTLVTWDDDGNFFATPGAASALRYLKSKNFRIVVYSCRIGIAKSNGYIEREIELMVRVLNDLDLSFDEIDLGEKVIADVYIDDRAVSYRGDWQETMSAVDRLFENDVKDSR